MKRFIKRTFNMTITDCNDLEHLNWMLPQACIEACTTSGDNGPACLEWTEALGMAIPRDKCIHLIQDTVGDEWEDLNEQTDEQLNVKLLWLAAWYDR